ncbi:thioredoxin domain-containing protein [Bacillaceae bacterium Marseille-Q3522]|nr:thioredoxin domain-containing protein [Bacillaceae bacterium Marseille-Q3522]
MAMNKKPNRLITEKSPYLLQHAYNPVEWHPWSEAAFQKAKKENKPVFVSIGYSTCHWCHVMERESFEDEVTAKLLNKHFVSIKVDREERPDIDSIYMNICQMMTGQGGWPLHVFLTPEQKPFYAGTYFPKTDMYGRPGFQTVLNQLSRQYHKNRSNIEEVANHATEALQLIQIKSSESLPQADILHETYNQLAENFQSVYGGFSAAPKFPIPHQLMYLLRYYALTRKETALKMVERTLNAMADGGIYDHIGFGFARYSTDESWLVPHFEKMLYDNALLLYVYTEALQLTKNPRYQKIIDQVVTFVNRELQDESGAFYSAIDADSEGIEGKYYVWTKDEILNVLGNEDGELFCAVYQITEDGNFEDKNIPNLIYSDKKEIFQGRSLSFEEGNTRLEKAREKLLQIRSQRVYPHLDDKILTSWNGLMIAALAKAGQVLKKTEYIEYATKALHFIETNLTEDDKLFARYRDGEAKHPGYLDDYAFLLWAYLELYEATFSYQYLEKAVQLAETMTDAFWDKEGEGFFFTSKASEKLLVREKQFYDGAIPSGNSVAAVQLLRLGHLTGETKWLKLTDQLSKAYQSGLASFGMNFTFFLQSVVLRELGIKELVILGTAREKIRKKLQDGYAPHLMFVVPESGFAREYKIVDETLTVYICEHFSCQRPVTSEEELWNKLQMR